MPTQQTECPQSNRANAIEQKLVASRLGPYAGLFYALRSKHPPTAAHCLRVAIGCSKWADYTSMEDQHLLNIEIAALLHDIGKIGVPDAVLQKPAGLTSQEQLAMSLHPTHAVQMLANAGASQDILNVIRYSQSRSKEGLAGFDKCSDGVRRQVQMIKIADAFDSITMEQVFRKAMSRERAIEELFKFSGTQFDNDLVIEFSELISQPRPELDERISARWLGGLQPDTQQDGGAAASAFSFIAPSGDHAVHSPSRSNELEELFHGRLLGGLADGVVYLDPAGQILLWNRAMERLTGVSSSAIMHRKWHPALINLAGEDGNDLLAEQCPVFCARSSNAAFQNTYQIIKDSSSNIVTQLMALPVVSEKREVVGLILIFRDASDRVSLESKVRTLHAIATQDPLTKTANRAELQRALPKFFADCIEQDRRGALIICDIDYFKRINDQHGHPAGDAALVTFAGVLKEWARNEDVVARYGGEEFVFLCEDCDIPTATARAESVRRAVEQTPVPALKNATMTASFGVTEIQPGDDVETLFARADRALLMAKESGRNRVVQLGAGVEKDESVSPRPISKHNAKSKASWFSWFSTGSRVEVSREYLASVPDSVARQKLEGFIADHRGEVERQDDDHYQLKVDGRSLANRDGERACVIALDIKLQSVKICHHGQYSSRTMFSVIASPIKARDRRESSLLGQVNRILQSFQSYMVAQEIDEDLRANLILPR